MSNPSDLISYHTTIADLAHNVQQGADTFKEIIKEATTSESGYTNWDITNKRTYGLKLIPLSVAPLFWFSNPKGKFADDLKTIFESFVNCLEIDVRANDIYIRNDLFGGGFESLYALWEIPRCRNNSKAYFIATHSGIKTTTGFLFCHDRSEYDLFEQKNGVRTNNAAGGIPNDLLGFSTRRHESRNLTNQVSKISIFDFGDIYRNLIKNKDIGQYSKCELLELLHPVQYPVSLMPAQNTERKKYYS